MGSELPTKRLLWGQEQKIAGGGCTALTVLQGDAQDDRVRSGARFNDASDIQEDCEREESRISIEAQGWRRTRIQRTSH
jgi:hypothetical protein